MRHLDLPLIVEEIVTEDCGVMLQPHVLLYYAMLGETHDLTAAYELASDYQVVLATGYKAQRQGLLDTRRQTLRTAACQKLAEVVSRRAPQVLLAWNQWLPYVDGSSKDPLPVRVKALERLATEDDKNLIAVCGLKTVKKDSSDLVRLEYYAEIAIAKARGEVAALLIGETNMLPIMKQEALAQ